MVTKRSPLLAVVLLCGVLVAGCGSSSNSSSSSANTTGTAATTSATPTTSTTVPPGGGANSQITQAAVAACKAGVAHAAVSASVKAKLETICNEAASGNLDAAREAAKKVCVEIVNSSPLPAGAAKEAALSACKKEQAP